MATRTEPHGEHRPRVEARARAPATEDVHPLESGTLTETVCGAGAVVLAILGLIGVLPMVLGPIGAMSVGVGLFVSGGVIAARYSRMEAARMQEGSTTPVTGGLGLESLAGVAGGVLGLLALVNVDSVVLLAISGIVLGSAVLFGSAAMARLESAMERIEWRREERDSHYAVYAAGGSDALIGAGAITLGILALIGFDPITLSLVAILSVGAATMLSGSALTARIFSVFGV